MNSFRKLLFSLLAIITLPVFAGDVVVKVTNVEDIQRQHLVELDLKTIVDKMGLAENASFIVKNAAGQQVDYQKTYDGKLLIDAAVKPCGTSVFTITPGVPDEMKCWVHGAMYPIRKDDIAWENDRCAYRTYGPALQKTGERAFGIDVWTKNTPELVVEKRFYKDYQGNVTKNEMNREGRKEDWNKVNYATSFHLDHGDGLDCYSVGPTLGCGAPALMDGKKLIMPYCYKTYKILDNGPLRFTVELTYNPAEIKKDKEVVEHRIISLDKGSNFNQMTVWYEGLSKPCDMAAGVVIHTGDTESIFLGKDYVLYADPTDRKEYGYQLYVGALFPQGAQTQTLMFDTPEGGNAGHAVGVVKGLKNLQRYTYYFGSGWSCYDVRSMNEWKLRAEEFLGAVNMPFEIEIE